MKRSSLRTMLCLPAFILLLPADPSSVRAQAGGAAGRGCAAMAVASWSPGGSRAYRVEASATGRTCAAANVALVVRGAQRQPMLTFASAAADLPYPFSDVRDAVAMEAALRRWMRQPQPARTTRDLPPWPAGAAEPRSGTMAFNPEPLIDRGRYSDLQRRARPTFCFAEGGGRIACYALNQAGQELTPIGTIARLP